MPEVAQVLRIILVSFGHIEQPEFFLLLSSHEWFFAEEHAALGLFSSMALRLFSSDDRQVEQAYGIVDEVKLDSFVKWAVCAVARERVDFDEPWLEPMVNHDVKSQDLEA